MYNVHHVSGIDLVHVVNLFKLCTLEEPIILYAKKDAPLSLPSL